MVETEHIVISNRTAGWTNAPLRPIAVRLVGPRPRQRRLVAILLLLDARVRRHHHRRRGIRVRG